METYHGGNFLYHVKAILMKSANSEGDGTPTGDLFSPNEASSTGTGFHLIDLLAKRVL